MKDKDHYKIEEIGEDKLGIYSQIPMTLEVRSVLVVEEIDGGLGGLKLTEQPVAEPYIKDYDSYEDLYADDENQNCGPEGWPRHFDISNWHICIAYSNDKPVGGAAIAYNTDGVNMLEGRSDMAVLWDIRVHPDHKGKGIGTILFNHAVSWARSKFCTLLKIETQNVNVPACRFYARQGCHLGQIHRYGYYGHRQVGREVMLVWYLDL